MYDILALKRIIYYTIGLSNSRIIKKGENAMKYQIPMSKIANIGVCMATLTPAMSAGFCLSSTNAVILAANHAL